ncbi:hypothetical protein [Shouchella rhizosphaerae]|uniref:hypothetical protein n=1 Tax=Shouchella rhizosphaerae TaxID=866786 RepID=UPI000BA6D718|nr:hypothetical protein [Shouchella rhizosphaerae]MCM3379207.1 hypothetical protein [Shouchella rhizosphaerae]PAD48523.1 hypothetical protein CHI09_00690 [Shouchella clausii]
MATSRHGDVGFLLFLSKFLDRKRKNEEGFILAIHECFCRLLSLDFKIREVPSGSFCKRREKENDKSRKWVLKMKSMNENGFISILVGAGACQQGNQGRSQWR